MFRIKKSVCTFQGKCYKKSVRARLQFVCLYEDVHKTPKTISTLFTIPTLQRCLLSLLLLFNEILKEHNFSLTANAWSTIKCSMDNDSLRPCALRSAAAVCFHKYNINLTN